jgi:hypothetical protein
MKREYRKMNARDHSHKTQSVTEERIDPATALRYLESNTINRTLRPGLVGMYAADMRAGKWSLSNDMVVFAEDGSLLNGQHRLRAIVESKTSQLFFVLRNAPRAAMINLDNGATRNIRDNAKIVGVEGGFSTRLVACTRAIHEASKSKGMMSFSQRLEIIERHREAAEFAILYGPKSGVLRSAIVYAAIGRAYYIEHDLERLKIFGHLASVGFSENPEDRAALATRLYFEHNRGTVISDRAGWRSAFLRTQNAIWHFMRRQPISSLRPIAEERYPLVDSVARSIARLPTLPKR